ncbi:MAG TPA: DinB family protein [Thermoanaerobaculia bacterium]|nr:DinB family protein [Thermoanaerobaculia bacterium]
MSIAHRLLPEFTQEMATTRRVLDRIPEDRLNWQPHAKSMTLGRLATHLAEIPGYAALTLTQEGLDLAAARAAGAAPKILATRQEILDLFDANVATGRAAIEATGDDTFGQAWTMRRGEQVIFTLPRVGALNSVVIHHTIHHRGQLSVYLRLNDVAVPSIYGPSADEQ